MKISTDNAGSPIGFVLVGGLGVGVAYGAVRSFHLSLLANVLSFAVIVLVMLLIFKRGRSSAWSSAQSWAQSQVDIALDVTAQAQAQAQALSEAYATAIAQANAQAVNNVMVNVPELTAGLSNSSVVTDKVTQQIEGNNLHETFNAHLARVAVEKLIEEKSEALRKSSNPERGLPTSL